MKQNFYQGLVRCFGVVITIVASFFIAWYFNHDKETIIDIQKISDVQITHQPDVDGLSAIFLFYDSVLQHDLWRTTYVLRNVGETTLFGDGFDNANIRNKYIDLDIHNCSNVLSVSIDTSNNAALIINNKLYVRQWRPTEYVVLTIVSEGTNSPSLMLNDRDIKNAKITTSVFSPSEDRKDKRIIDVLPQKMVNVLRWICLAISLFFALIFSIALPLSVKTSSKSDKVSTYCLLFAMLLIILLPLCWMFYL